MSKYIEDIYKVETDKGTIRINKDGIRVAGKGCMYLHYEWDYLFELKSLGRSIERIKDKGPDLNDNIRLRYPDNILDVLGVNLHEERYEYGEYYYLDIDRIRREFDMNLESCRLTPKELSITRMYYKDIMTLNEISKEFLIGIETVRSVLARVMLKLKHSNDLRKLLCLTTIDYPTALQQSIDKATKQYMEEHVHEIMDSLPKEIRKMYNEIVRSERDKDILIKELNRRKEMNVPIKELDLSIRSYNCLKRTQLDTVKEVVEYFKQGKLLKIRNLGKKCYKEIVNKLIYDGYIEEEDDDA